MCLQVFALATGMVAFVPGFAAAGILALLSPLFLPFLPVFAPVRPRKTLPRPWSPPFSSPRVSRTSRPCCSSAMYPAGN